MEQYHRKLISSYMFDLISVTFNLENIVNKLLEATIINEWMKNYILVRNFNLILVSHI